MGRGLLVAGTTSDAGKSLLTAGLCRWLARSGVRVAPFKAQNMSNNSMVCPDGTEIGRAQWVQALAAGAVPEAAMNPVLLKPGSDRRSHVVLLGRPAGELGTGEWASGRRELAAAAFAAFDDLASRYDVVLAEGAGSAAEVNLRAGDYVNLGLARAVNLPVVVVGDIDRGGVLAAFYGTWALLDDADRAHLRGWIVNKFRGDVGLLRPGLRIVEERTGLPVHGVLPWLPGLWLDGEDALALGGWATPGAMTAPDPGGGAPGTPLRVVVVRLPRLSNATDIDALAAEPGVDVVLSADPDAVHGADLAVLPGSRSTIGDLAWVRSRGLDGALAARARAGRPILGVCGGYQMLAETVDDPDGVETGAPASVPGLGLLPTRVTFHAAKTLGTPAGAWRGQPVTAYEIHHGVATLEPARDPGVPRRQPTPGTGRDPGVPGADLEPFLDGWRRGAVFGTTWHGTFENDGFRRAFLTDVARRAGHPFRPRPDAPGFRARREAMLDRLADAVEEHLDTAALRALIEG